MELKMRHPIRALSLLLIMLLGCGDEGMSPQEDVLQQADLQGEDAQGDWVADLGINLAQVDAPKADIPPPKDLIIWADDEGREDRQHMDLAALDIIVPKDLLDVPVLGRKDHPAPDWEQEERLGVSDVAGIEIFLDRPGGREDRGLADIPLDWMQEDRGSADIPPDWAQEDVSPPQEICDDHVDNDADGLADCMDPDCQGQSCGDFGLTCQNAVCLCPGGLASELNCVDGIDDDCNSLADCADFACSDEPLCKANICSGDYTITQSRDIEELSHCVVITGTLYVESPSLVDLRGMEALVRTGGGLYIGNNRALACLDGLDGLTSIGGSLLIGLVFTGGNDELRSLGGLSHLRSVYGVLGVRESDKLTNLEGLEGISAVGNDVAIVSNDGLTSLDGLSGISSIGGELTITDNPLLVDVDGLSSVTSIGDYVDIYDNYSLTNLDGLSSLTTIGTYLDIHDNNSLASVEGLSALLSMSGDMDITRNPRLPNCQAMDLRDQLSSFLDEVCIGCNMEDGCPEDLSGCWVHSCW